MIGTFTCVRRAFLGISLVTGGAGFIGSHLAELLLAHGDRVIVLDNLSTGKLENLQLVESHGDLEVVVDTVLNEPLVTALVARADRVFHLAAAVGVRLIVTDPLRVVETNVSGTAAILRACAASRRPVFLASSSEVYGKSEQLPFREDDDVVFGPPSRARWSYGSSKMIGEFLGQTFARLHRLPVVTARLFNTAGPRQTGSYGMVVPRFIEQALSGQPMTVYGDGRQTRCFCHVADIAAAIVRLLSTERCAGHLVNLGQERPVSINGLAERIKFLTRSQSKIVHLPFEQAYEAGFEDIQDRQPDLRKARELIGFRPTHCLDDIISDIVFERQHLCVGRGA